MEAGVHGGWRMEWREAGGWSAERLDALLHDSDFLCLDIGKHKRRGDGVWIWPGRSCEGTVMLYDKYQWLEGLGRD